MVLVIMPHGWWWWGSDACFSSLIFGTGFDSICFFLDFLVLQMVVLHVVLYSCQWLNSRGEEWTWKEEHNLRGIQNIIKSKAS
jgi:hypothetical protein